MSDPVRIETAATGMITLRGDLGDPALVAAIEAVAGTAVPGRRMISPVAPVRLAWMSPDELLLLCPADQTARLLRDLGQALRGTHHLAVDVSDARALFRLAGTALREVLAQGAPVDLAPGRFEPGMIRRSRIGQIAAAFWMNAPDSAELVCFRSVAGHMQAWLENAARPGAAPGLFASLTD
jgi:sarcosine oxidase, subunit gamma